MHSFLFYKYKIQCPVTLIKENIRTALKRNIILQEHSISSWWKNLCWTLNCCLLTLSVARVLDLLSNQRKWSQRLTKKKYILFYFMCKTNTSILLCRSSSISLAVATANVGQGVEDMKQRMSKIFQTKPHVNRPVNLPNIQGIFRRKWSTLEVPFFSFLFF